MTVIWIKTKDRTGSKEERRIEIMQKKLGKGERKIKKTK